MLRTGHTLATFRFAALLKENLAGASVARADISAAHKGGAVKLHSRKV
jgi:hypothetical protein